MHPPGDVLAWHIFARENPGPGGKASGGRAQGFRIASFRAQFSAGQLTVAPPLGGDMPQET